MQKTHVVNKYMRRYLKSLVIRMKQAKPRMRLSDYMYSTSKNLQNLSCMEQITAPPDCLQNVYGSMSGASILKSTSVLRTTELS